MLDLAWVRNNQAALEEALGAKQLDKKLAGEFLAADKAWREVLSQVEALRAASNVNVAKIKAELAAGKGQKPDPELVAAGKKIKEELRVKEEELKELGNRQAELALALPNIPAEDVPRAADESGNVVVREVGEKPQFAFAPQSHEDLMEELDILEVKRAVRIGGFRSYMLKNEAVILEQALLNYALSILREEGFVPMSVPNLVSREAMEGTGYFPWGADDHYFTQDGQILTGTAEVALTSYHGGEILNERDLPIKLAGISPCYRREVGTYGKDTKGIVRVHQFNKVEQVVYTVADEEETRLWHEKMLALAERILTDLDLPYQVLLMCTGDMGAPQRKKYDIETWFPSQGKYRETHSASYFNDFQARRLNIKYRANDGTTKYVYTLNNTMAASPRLLAAIIENYQQEDGTVIVPEVLRPWTVFERIYHKNS